MASTSPARIDDELYASAKLAGSVQSRSASQQVAHWARIGREIEASSHISPKEIAAVLAGSRSYDGLDPKEQAVVRAEWAARMEEARAGLDLAKDFAHAGRTWVELDERGRVVERGGASGAPAAKKRVAKRSAPAAGSPGATTAAARKRAAARKKASTAKRTGTEKVAKRSAPERAAKRAAPKRAARSATAKKPTKAAAARATAKDEVRHAG